MEKEKLIKKAEKGLDTIIENQSLPLYSIRDIIETIKSLKKQDYSYTICSDTKLFFKQMGFKTKEISTYYLIEI